MRCGPVKCGHNRAVMDAAKTGSLGGRRCVCHGDVSVCGR